VDEGRLLVRSDEPLSRARLSVALRVPLFVPALVVLTTWSLLALPGVVVAWTVLVVAGRQPERLHRFLSSYLRYAGQASAWFHLLSAVYPRPRRTSAHPFAIDVPEQLSQPRLVTLARAVLAVPALVLAGVLRVVLTMSAVGAWFAALALGRTTAGLQELGTFCLRYELEVEAYVLLLTSRYPRLAPE
jgi:Domain of unknown function (DUF4389)